MSNNEVFMDFKTIGARERDLLAYCDYLHGKMNKPDFEHSQEALLQILRDSEITQIVQAWDSDQFYRVIRDLGSLPYGNFDLLINGVYAHWVLVRPNDNYFEAICEQLREDLRQAEREDTTGFPAQNYKVKRGALARYLRLIRNA